MNSIPHKQNEPQQIERLAAQRQLYADAKRALAIQIIATTVVSVALAFFSVKYPALRVWGSLWGLGFTLLDVFFLAPWQKARKKTASTVQEMFDCAVLDLPWKRGREKVEAEDTVAAARRHERRVGREKMLVALQDRYAPAVGQVEIPLARVLCQRANIRWDAGLRGRYVFALWCLLILLIIGALVYGLANGLKMQEWLTTMVLPLQPLIVLLGRQIQENREAIETLARLKRTVKKLWDEALKNPDDEALLQGSRDLQDELWDHRSRSPLLFDWVYGMWKAKDEDEMAVGMGSLIADAQNSSAK